MVSRTIPMDVRDSMYSLRFSPIETFASSRPTFDLPGRTGAPKLRDGMLDPAAASPSQGKAATAGGGVPASAVRDLVPRDDHERVVRERDDVVDLRGERAVPVDHELERAA